MRYELYLANFDFANDCDVIEDKPEFITGTLETARKIVKMFYKGKFDVCFQRRYSALYIYDTETGEFVDENIRWEGK